MNVPKIDLKLLLEAGVHLGHKTLRWNPKMKQFIFGEKNSIHIIDLTQTVEFLKNALVQVHKTITRSWRTPRPQNIKVEPKNEEIYFWRKKFYSYYRLNPNSRFY